MLRKLLTLFYYSILTSSFSSFEPYSGENGRFLYQNKQFSFPHQGTIRQSKFSISHSTFGKVKQVYHMFTWECLYKNTFILQLQRQYFICIEKTSKRTISIKSSNWTYTSKNYIFIILYTTLFIPPHPKYTYTINNFLIAMVIFV